MNDLLAEKLFRSYRTGLLLRPPSRKYLDPSYDFLLKQVLSSKVPAYERVAIRKIWRWGYEGLRLSREGRLDEAHETFSRCWAELVRAENSRKNMLLARSSLEAAHAYFEYRRGNYELARTRVLKSMEADLQLQADDDFSLIEMHRLQSAQNLMRIGLRSGEPKWALALAGLILAYVEGLVHDLPVHHSWQGERFIARTPPAVRCIIIPQLAYDIAVAFSRFPLASLEGAFLEHVHTEEYLSRRQVLDERFRLWLLAKQALHQDDWDRYMEGLLMFLPLGRVGIQALWYSAILDLLDLCRKLNSQGAQHLRERILLDASKWPDLPAPLRASLEPWPVPHAPRNVEA